MNPELPRPIPGDRARIADTSAPSAIAASTRTRRRPQADGSGHAPQASACAAKIGALAASCASTGGLMLWFSGLGGSGSSAAARTP